MNKEINVKGNNTMTNERLNLYNWKVEELKLLKLRRYTGIISEIEDYSLEEKISILDSHYNGVVSYLIDITRKYNSYLAGIGDKKAMPLNSWLKKNDYKGIMTDNGYWEVPIFFDFYKKGLSEGQIVSNINNSFSRFINILLNKEKKYAKENNLKYISINRIPEINNIKFGNSKIPCEKFIGDLIYELYNYNINYIVNNSFKPFLQQIIIGNYNAIEELDKSIIQSIINYLLQKSEYSTDELLLEYEVTKTMLKTLKSLCKNGSIEKILTTNLCSEVNDIKKSVIEETLKKIEETMKYV